MEDKNMILGLDVSTKTIGISMFEDNGDTGELSLLHHVTPKPKDPKPETQIEELNRKCKIFEEEFLDKKLDFNIDKVIIEEPLLSSNNIYTAGILLKFNGMVSKSVYDALGISPDFISSYDARKYAFPDLMAKRTHKKDGTPLSEKEYEKKKPVLFGAYPFNVDKKEVIQEKVSTLQPDINWIYTDKGKFKKENYDMADAYVCVLGKMKMDGIWS